MGRISPLTEISNTFNFEIPQSDYNHALGEYMVDFEDGSVDYVSPEDIDGVEVIEIG